MTSLASAALMVLCFVAGSAHAAVYDCEMNGEHVNPANGSTYAGKTGIMKCVTAIRRSSCARPNTAAAARSATENRSISGATPRSATTTSIGVRQRYSESGQLESESTCEAGKLTRRKAYKDGRLEPDEEYFEDGSRKSARKGS
jgi:hypothetical protein